jgi:prevent-host-death family protein
VSPEAVEVGVRELRSHLSGYLRRVRAGASITITARGRPVARLQPVERDGTLDRLVAEGIVTPARRPRRRPRPRPTTGPVSDLVAGQRR